MSRARPRPLVVVSDARDLPGYEGPVVTADAFLAGEPVETRRRSATVVNLCRSWRYLSKGYYVSLLAEARGQRVLPDPRTVEGISNPRVTFRAIEEAGLSTVDEDQMSGRRCSLPATIAPDVDARGGSRRARPLVRQLAGDVVTYRPAEAAEMVELDVFLGRCREKAHRRLASAIYKVWPLPCLRVRLLREEESWKVIHVAPLRVRSLDARQREALVEALEQRPQALAPRSQRDHRAVLAVLLDENDPHAPSTPETIDRLERVAAKEGVHLRRIALRDVGRLGDADALFIRTLTGPALPAFRFALEAEALGMPVIDDTRSILRCSNKVYLHELLTREGVATPGSVVATPGTRFEELEDELGLPFVVKLPDGAFSAAVFKVTTREEYRTRAADLFRRSPLIIAQAWTPTEFDWRVTTLGGRPLFVCKYHMATGHWQIAANTGAGTRFGRVEAVPIERAPRDVMALGVRASKLIGDGLYGVDLKQTPAGPVVVEVNDNPNIDIGYDDGAEGDEVYRAIARWFLERIAASHRPAPEPSRTPPRAVDPVLASLRSSIGRARRRRERAYRAFEVCGLELEYPVVDRDLNCVSRVEDVLRVLAGRATSDVSLGVVGFANEIADHVLEVRTDVPLVSLVRSEEYLVEGVRRAAAVLADRFDARLLPTGMHPWLDPRKARRWSRSHSRIYETYARLFDTATHGWMNVQSCHVNLPLGREHEAVALLNACALLVPYLPALAASSPMHDGELQPAVCGRVAFILDHQARLPESTGPYVPEFCQSLAGYRRDVLRPMYRALDEVPGTATLRREFLNARAAVIKASRESLEVRVLDTQECVKMDVAIACFTRATLRWLARELGRGRIELPDHAALVADLRASVWEGTRAVVAAPHLGERVERDAEGRAAVRDVLRLLLARARREAKAEEEPYLDLVAAVIEQGNLSERIAAVLAPHVDDEDAFTMAARRVYIELSDCLIENAPWRGRGLDGA